MDVRGVLYRSVVLAGAIVSFIASTDAFAIVSLKKVQVTDGNQIDLLFDGKVSQAQVQSEYFNDIIQISLTDVSVYPAKISSLSGMDLTKVFAYQYSPKLVRCRFTVKGKAENFRDRVRVKARGKILSLMISSGNKATVASESEPVKNPKVGAVPALTAMSEDERILLDRVMKSQAAPAKVEAKNQNSEKAQTIEKSEKSEKADKNEKNEKIEPLTRTRGALATGKPLPSPFKALASLVGVLFLFCVGAIVIKKIRGPKLENHKGFSGFLGKIANIGIGQKPKMIEVVANHYLGPKKNIAVVRVAGRLLVLGVTNESINLITQLKDSAGAQETAAESAGDALAEESIAESLMSIGMTPQVTAPAMASSAFSDVLSKESARPGGGVRAQIRTRLGGMKQL